MQRGAAPAFFTSAHELYFTGGALGAAGGAVTVGAGAADGAGTSEVMTMGAAVVVVGAEAEDALTVVVGASTSFWIAVIVVGAGFASSLPPQEVRSNTTGIARAAIIRFTEESNQTDRS
ncbi:hypothetical protein QV65_32830 [Rhodococcus erythropolis]|nr:hypothetical protein QV65_32830 [Rhodococcus erythropolis]